MWLLQDAGGSQQQSGDWKVGVTSLKWTLGRSKLEAEQEEFPRQSRGRQRVSSDTYGGVSDP